MTSEMVKAARMLLHWDQKDLAAASGLSLPTIKRLEAKPGQISAYSATIKVMRLAIEEAGVVFVSADTTAGAGVRLRITDAG